MKKVSKLSIITLAVLLAGCNEKVSPELQEGNASTPDSPTTPVAPEEYYFGIENSSDTLLNYKLHKTGAGNRNAKCEVKNTSKLSNDMFRGNPAANDITCFFEADELSLFHSGFNFKVKASKNTCDFVGYMPYGYYNDIPGDSSGTYYQVTCSGEETNASHVGPSAIALGIDLDDFSGNPVGCNDWIAHDSVIPAGTRERFTPKDDQAMCRFNYKLESGGSADCDIGKITVNEVVISYTPATDTEPPILKQEIVPREIDCAGKIYNCVEGPTTLLKKNASRVIENTKTALNKDFEKEYKYDKSVDLMGSNIFYANYRRNLASTQIDYATSAGLTPAYKSIWADPTYGRTYEPRVADFFSANMMFDNTTNLIDSPRLEAEAVRNNKWYAKPLAADPFLGLAERVNPFYTFYCFDTAYDIKARIRMVVRDWDRISLSNSDQELLSDLYKGTSAHQDAPGLVELPDEHDTYVTFNDRTDWDDLIPMDRTLGPFDPFSTVYRPTGTLTYPDGWFRPAIFPQVYVTDE